MRRTALCLTAYLTVADGVCAQTPIAESGVGASPIVAAAPEAGGPRRWQVAHPDGAALRDRPASDARAVETVADRAILSNLGCEQAAGEIWCEAQLLGSRTRGYVLADHLRPARGPDGTVPMGVDDSAPRARKGDFDAKGKGRCAQIRSDPLGPCEFGAARGGGGDAAVVFTFSNGFERTLFFSHGTLIRANPTMSGIGRDIDWRIEGQNFTLRVEDQRFELPTAAVLGD